MGMWRVGETRGWGREGGRGWLRGIFIGSEDMFGIVTREDDGRLVKGGHLSLFFPKHMRHFPPNQGVCSFPMPLPHSENIDTITIKV